jgi:precorrin isomerase
MSKSLITAQEKKRGRNYTPNQKKFLKELVKTNFQNPQESARVAKVRYWETCQALKEDMKEISEALLIGSAPSAALTITNILHADTDNPPVFVKEKMAAAKEILDRAGVVKQDQVNVNHTHGGGIFILPTKTEVVASEPLEVEYEHVEDL